MHDPKTVAFKIYLGEKIKRLIKKYRKNIPETITFNIHFY
jgi:hypothetical protein